MPRAVRQLLLVANVARWTSLRLHLHRYLGPEVYSNRCGCKRGNGNGLLSRDRSCSRLVMGVLKTKVQVLRPQNVMLNSSSSVEIAPVAKISGVIPDGFWPGCRPSRTGSPPHEFHRFKGRGYLIEYRRPWHPFHISVEECQHVGSYDRGRLCAVKRTEDSHRKDVLFQQG
jgi:hypothetical protein